MNPQTVVSLFGLAITLVEGIAKIIGDSDKAGK